MFTWIACKDWHGQSVQKTSDIISKKTITGCIARDEKVYMV